MGKMRHSRHPQACRRLTLYKPHSCDSYLPLDLTVRSHEMQHSALLVGLVSDSPGYELPCAEDNSLATAMLPLHRTKKSENRALNSASNIKDYIANGGSVSGLKAEVALGNVILDEANTDILTRGSYLWVSDSELHNRVEGVPTLSRFSESSSCWHLRVTLTPERPSCHSCIVHLLHPAH